MAHNRSPARQRSDVMAGLLGNYRGWQLHVCCPGPQCPKGRIYQVDALLADHPTISVAELIHRLRCTACRGPLRDVVLVDVQEVRRMPLLGSEVRW